MRVWRHLVPTSWLLVGIASCDPVVLLDARRVLRPAPATDCVRSALASSPDLSWVSPQSHEGRRDFQVTLRAATPWAGLRYATIYRAPSADSTDVWTMNFSWGGRWRPPPADEEQAATAVAKRVFAQIRAACAPDAPATIECVYSTGKRAASCAPAT